MAYRRKFDWPPEVREALLDDVQLWHAAALEAETRLKIRIYLAVEQGLTTREIAVRLGISQQMVSRYRIEGEAAQQARSAPE